MTTLLCSTPEIVPASEQWGKTLAALVKMLEGEGEHQQDNDIVGAEEIEYMSSAGFSKLSFASDRAGANDPFKALAPDCKTFLAQKLAALSQQSPGAVGRAAQQFLDVGSQQTLQVYCRNAGVSLA